MGSLAQLCFDLSKSSLIQRFKSWVHWTIGSGTTMRLILAILESQDLSLSLRCIQWLSTVGHRLTAHSQTLEVQVNIITYSNRADSSPCMFVALCHLSATLLGMPYSRSVTIWRIWGFTFSEFLFICPGIFILQKMEDKVPFLIKLLGRGN